MNRRSRSDRDQSSSSASAPTRKENRRDDAFANPANEATQPIEGIIAGETVRSGEDSRRRGWFWHWNSIVTQYAPLIGLKGVGLLNSYTVWTDRRETSPHRGYAFPSQQSEADFYGEDRAELITINKILVALDLIEIRKEMVLRVDEQGRRWRVPHNFYRVKDHDDNFNLDSSAVLRVVELADRDKAVYRYIRRIFSPRFSAIDPDNHWHRMLPTLRETDVWQRLAARAEREEDRASARTRAGHETRKASNRRRKPTADTPTAIAPSSNTDKPAQATVDNDSDTDKNNEVQTTSVERINNGLSLEVEQSNKGSANDSTTAVAAGNAGEVTAVGQSNRMYNQSTLTTRTTSLDIFDNDQSQPVTGAQEMPPSKTTPVTPSSTAQHFSTDGSMGPGEQAAPTDIVGEQAAIRAYEDANNRKASPTERKLLRQLAKHFEAAAQRNESPQRCNGYDWVVDAIVEAVEAGSAYVAPRRIREILNRWEREGKPIRGENTATPPPLNKGESITSSAENTFDRVDPMEQIALGDGPDFGLPHGFGSRRTWQFTVSLLGVTLDQTRLRQLVTGTWISGYRDGEVTLTVPASDQAEQLAGEYRELVTRKLSEAMRRPIRLAVLTADLSDKLPESSATTPIDDASEYDQPEQSVRIFMIEECGLPSNQVWAAVLDEVVQGGKISQANFDAWLRPTVLLHRDDTGCFIVGTPHTLGQRRITSRFQGFLERALMAIVGGTSSLKIVTINEWLTDNHHQIENPASTDTFPDEIRA